MSKKKSSSKSKGGKKRYRASAKTRAGRAAELKGKSRGKAKRSPRAQSLPGLETARHGRLDQLCASLGDVRDEKNKWEKDETDLKVTALKYMIANNVQAYRHAGIEVLRVPDAEKLRVRKSSDEAEAATRS